MTVALATAESTSKYADLNGLILMAPAGGSLQVTSQLTAEAKILFTYYAAPGPSIERTKALFRALAYDASGVAEETLRERYEASTDPEAMAYNTRMCSQWATLGPAHWRRVNEIQHQIINFVAETA